MKYPELSSQQGTEGGSIRLLHLKAATDHNAMLECQLIETDILDHHIEYRALSYTWASASPTTARRNLHASC